MMRKSCFFLTTWIGSYPDRDFLLFIGGDKERIAYWNTAVNESERLAEEFLDVVQTGRIRERVKPMPGSG